jgi:hypothetical protein
VGDGKYQLDLLAWDERPAPPSCCLNNGRAVRTGAECMASRPGGRAENPGAWGRMKPAAWDAWERIAWPAGQGAERKTPVHGAA